MESKVKTKKEIEAETPFINRDNCPQELIKWWQRDKVAERQTLRLIIRAELKPMLPFMKTVNTHSILLVVLAAASIAQIIIVIVK